MVLKNRIQAKWPFLLLPYGNNQLILNMVAREQETKLFSVEIRCKLGKTGTRLVNFWPSDWLKDFTT